MIRIAHDHRAPRAFTILEIMIVATLIALLSGIAIISVQMMFDQNRKKVMHPEAQQIGTALSFAFNDIGFYPRLHLLNQQHSNMIVTNASNELLSMPHMDSYGYLNSKSKASIIDSSWRGPYAAKSATRMSQGQRSFVKMRLPDIEINTYKNLFQQKTDMNIQIVDWPADTWSNPWMVYQVSKTVDSSGKPKYVLCRPGEQPDWKNAVVSYGANHVPGGNEDTVHNHWDYYDFLKTKAALYFEDNAGGDFVLRSYGSTQLDLRDLTSDQLRDSFFYPGTVDAKTGAVGMFEEGTDDIIWEF